MPHGHTGLALRAARFRGEVEIGVVEKEDFSLNPANFGENGGRKLEAFLCEPVGSWHTGTVGIPFKVAAFHFPKLGA